MQRRISQSYLNWNSRSFLWLFRHGSRVSTNFGHLSASFFSCERRHENNILIGVICCAIYTFDWSLIKRPLRCFSSKSLKDLLQVYACPVKETEEKIQDYPQAELPREAECQSISFSVCVNDACSQTPTWSSQSIHGACKIFMVLIKYSILFWVGMNFFVLQVLLSLILNQNNIKFQVMSPAWQRWSCREDYN